MEDGDHKHDSRNPFGRHNHRKILMIAIFGILFAMIAYITATEQDIAFEVVLNNTNLAPTMHPSIPGTGERVNATTYYANSSALDLHVFAHANNVSQVAGTFVYINGTLVCARAGRPLAIPEVAYRGCDLTIPKHSYYRVEFTDYHHYEWREYPILSGRNGTLSINQTIIGGAGNATDRFNEIWVNKISKNDTSVTDEINLNTNNLLMNGTDTQIYNLNPFPQYLRFSPTFIALQNNKTVVNSLFLNADFNELSSINHSNVSMLRTHQDDLQWLVYNSTSSTGLLLNITQEDYNLTDFRNGAKDRIFHIDNNRIDYYRNSSMNGKEILDSPTFNAKLNKSGDTMSGNLTLDNVTEFSNRSVQWSSANNIANGPYVIKNNDNITSVFRDSGVQSWFMYYTGTNVFGYSVGDFGGGIIYSIPNGGVGISFRNSTPGTPQSSWQSMWRHDLYIVPDGGSNSYLCIAPGNSTSAPTCKVKVYNNYTVQIEGLAGTGNRPLCAHADGIVYAGTINLATGTCN